MFKLNALWFLLMLLVLVGCNQSYCVLTLDLGHGNQEINQCDFLVDVPLKKDDVFSYEILTEYMLEDSKTVKTTPVSGKMYDIEGFGEISMSIQNESLVVNDYQIKDDIFYKNDLKSCIFWTTEFYHENHKFIVLYIQHDYSEMSSVSPSVKAILINEAGKIYELPEYQSTTTRKNIYDFDGNGTLDYVHLDTKENVVNFYSLINDKFVLDKNNKVYLEYWAGIYAIEHQKTKWFGKSNKTFLFTEKYPCECKK